MEIAVTRLYGRTLGASDPVVGVDCRSPSFRSWAAIMQNFMTKTFLGTSRLLGANHPRYCCR
jgi:hypothetical protein